MYNLLGVKCSGNGIKIKKQNKIKKRLYKQGKLRISDNSLYLNRYTKQPLKVY